MHILDVIVHTGLTPVGPTLLLGMALSDDQVVWSQCGPLPDRTVAATLIEQTMAPLVRYRPVTDAPDLITTIEELRHQVTFTRPVAAPATPPGVSRRQFLTGAVTPELPQPEMERVTEERPLPAALRFSFSHLLLQALAVAQRVTLPALLVAHYELPRPVAAPRLLVEVASEANIKIIHPIITDAVAAVAYSTSHDRHKEVLGEQGERLQAHVRRVKEWLTTVDPEANVRIHLNIQGGYTQLYDGDEGKILGALYGLERAAQPYRLVIENVIQDNAATVAATLNQLDSYLTIRKMKTRLALGYSLFTVAELADLAAAGAGHQLHLALSQLGSFDDLMRLLALCREQDLAVILRDDGVGAGVTAALGLAAGAWAMSGPPAPLYNALVRLQAEKNVKNLGKGEGHGT